MGAWRASPDAKRAYWRSYWLTHRDRKIAQRRARYTTQRAARLAQGLPVRARRFPTAVQAAPEPIELQLVQALAQQRADLDQFCAEQAARIRRMMVPRVPCARPDDFEICWPTEDPMLARGHDPQRGRPAA